MITDVSDYEEVMGRQADKDKAIDVMVRRGAYTYFVAIEP